MSNLALIEAPAVRGRDTAGLVEDFLSGRSPRTLRAYQGDLRDFAAFLEADSIPQAIGVLLSGGPGNANALALRYKADLGGRGLAPSTINRRLAALRSLTRLARTVGVVTWGLEVRNVKAARLRDTRGPGVAGVRLLLDQLQGSGSKAVRDRAILRLLYDLGLRRGEVVSLDLEDVEAGGLWIKGKGRGEKELLTLPEPTVSALEAWLEVRGQEPGPLFVNFDHAGKGKRLTGTSVYRIVRDLGERAGIKTRPHGLRHASITEACKLAQANGIGLEEVRDFSRHADVSTLMIYRDRERDVQGRIASLVAGECM